MDFVKVQLDRIQQQLSGLSASQKMLTGTLVVIMVMTMMWWGKYAGTAEMEAVLNQALSDEDIGRITDQLAMKGIPHSVTSDKKVLVPADKRWEILAGLGYSQLLPRNTESGFEAMVKQMNPLDGPSKTDKFWNHAAEMTLSRIIGRFPGVASAVVMIDPTRVRNFDGGVQPSATVNITMQSGASGNKQLVNAAASVVAGAQSGLAKERISVVIDGVAQRVQSSNDPTAMSDSYFDLKAQYERWFSNKVAEQLSFIRGVIVTVSVDVENKTIAEERHDYDPTKVVQKEIETKEHTEETTNSAPAASGDGGVLPNVSAQIASPAGSGSSSTSTDTGTKFQILASEAKSQISTPAGKETVIGASVRVPRSYFVQMWLKKNPNGKEPEDAVLQPLVDMELPKIRNDVKKCTGLKKDDEVSVETYIDVSPLAAMASTTSASSSIGLSVAGYSKEIAVGILAVASLLMMGLMVRKGSPMPALAASVSREPGVPHRLDSGEAIAGEAGEAGALLDALEMDPDTIKTQQMLDQVSTMVKENPDAAANLVKRWLNRA